MTNLECVVRIKIRAGQLEGFKAQAAEILRIVRERDTKTLRYDWFINEDALECEIHESYVNEQGVLEHGQHIAEARERMFKEYAYDHQMSLFGDVSEQLKQLFKQRGMSVGLFAFAQGLEQPAAV